MSKRKYRVRAECPACACGDVAFPGPETLREKFIGDEKEIEILCPMCGTKHKGKFGFIRELVEVLDSHRIPILSLLSFPKSEKGDWLIIVRVKAADTKLAAEDLKKKGFNVVDIT